VEQSLCELKTKKAKIGSNLIVVETANTQVMESLFSAVYLLFLADLFFFGFSFFQLLDLLFYNTSQSFL